MRSSCHSYILLWHATIFTHFLYLQASSLAKQGDADEAKRNATIAKRLSAVSIGVGGLAFILVATPIFVVVYIYILAATTYTSS